MTRIDMNERELRELATRAATLQALKGVGDKVAERAALAAPKRTGAGAASIHAEVVDDEVRVGPDAEHWYLIFSEVGTSRAPARPFLRPALDGHYDV
jgi:HK97 gp10 family phage protein